VKAKPFGWLWAFSKAKAPTKAKPNTPQIPNKSNPPQSPPILPNPLVEGINGTKLLGSKEAKCFESGYG
jgi:hypothetical protein